MHGTFVNATGLIKNDPRKLVDGDIITFGTTVVRGESESFFKDSFLVVEFFLLECLR